MSKEEKMIEEVAEKEPSSFRLIFTLGFAGFMSGLILVGVFLFTKPIIENNKAEALKRAIFKVLPGTTTFKTLALDNNGKLAEYNPSPESKKGEEPERIFFGMNDNGEFTGVAIHGGEPGFQDIIGVLFGYDAVGKMVIGYEVLQCKETPGLGDKIFKDEAFVMNFTQLAVEPEIVPVKKGEKQNPNEVEAITGATISSKAVVRLLNKNLTKWKTAIEAYLKENQISTPAKDE